MEKVSVIIPMYNSELFIRKCLQSVMDQTYPELEILVIDDGSTDRGPQICREMSCLDDRICLHPQKNGGVSRARNQGLHMASGKYVFFLDSDDAIHPCLLQELVGQMEEQSAGLAFCGYRKLDNRGLEKALEEETECAGPLQWESADKAAAEEWFHISHVQELTGIGGKMILKSLTGELWFDESLVNGEDTLFLYQLVSRQIRIVRLSETWYYYRMHPQSATHMTAGIRNKEYFESIRRVRDQEIQKGRPEYAVTWENFIVQQIENHYLALKGAKDRDGCAVLKRTAALERKEPLFRQLFFSMRFLFCCCFSCYPLYVLLRRMMPVLLKMKGSKRMDEKKADVGIITFHCSNNYGAMLQTYGLKSFLNNSGIRADVVRYEPPYMTGRHWWIPYVPFKGASSRIWCVVNLFTGFAAHLKMGRNFAGQRANMNRFRKEHLIRRGQRRIWFENGLSSLSYRYYIVGSDQIWNPNITCGLRRAYFGAFKNRYKEKVVAYAASFGGISVPAAYDDAFQELIKHVDAVSMREEAAIPYVKKFYPGAVTAVLDPVFFLKKAEWEKVEKAPDRSGYIFVYITERNRNLSDYARKLSQDTGLPVLEVRTGQLGTQEDFSVDFTAGPAEFLGYIHKADYVVTNSFHAVAFSILYQKKFLAFAHSNLGARLQNILHIHGLEDRLCRDGQEAEIDACVDWKEVRKRTEEAAEASGNFLKQNLSGQ